MAIVIHTVVSHYFSITLPFITTAWLVEFQFFMVKLLCGSGRSSYRRRSWSITWPCAGGAPGNEHLQVDQIYVYKHKQWIISSITILYTYTYLQTFIHEPIHSSIHPSIHTWSRRDFPPGDVIIFGVAGLTTINVLPMYKQNWLRLGNLFVFLITFGDFQMSISAFVSLHFKGKHIGQSVNVLFFNST